MLWDNEKEYFVDFTLEVLGLRFPNNDNLKPMLVILWLCAEREFTPDEAYEELRSLGDKFVNKRSIMSGRAMMRDCTRDASSFFALYPHQYLACDPPVATQLDDRKLQQKMRKDAMPSRNTNETLRQKQGQQAASP